MHNYDDNLLLTSANKVEELLSLEAQYGPLSGYRPAINTVLNYLQQVWMDIITCILQVRDYLFLSEWWHIINLYPLRPSKYVRYYTFGGCFSGKKQVEQV